jgi:hypothetical protein
MIPGFRRVILVHQMQSLLVSWRCKRFVNSLWIDGIPLTDGTIIAGTSPCTKALPLRNREAVPGSLESQAAADTFAEPAHASGQLTSRADGWAGLCRANATVIDMPAITPARTCLRLIKSPRYFHASLRCFHMARALIMVFLQSYFCTLFPADFNGDWKPDLRRLCQRAFQLLPPSASAPACPTLRHRAQRAFHSLNPPPRIPSAGPGCAPGSPVPDSAVS